jgi:hypothetical protein
MVAIGYWFIVYSMVSWADPAFVLHPAAAV